jgi:hypothetical protein
MRMKIVAGVIAVLVVGAGTVLVEAASNTTPPERQTTTKEIDTKTLLSSSSTTQDPLVNPSAAGTQMGWHGYAASSDATAPQSGTSSPGSITPGAGRITGPALVPPAASEVKNERQAQARLKQLGYSRIEEVRQAGKDGWVAVARKDRREVRVQLDNDGNGVSER